MPADFIPPRVCILICEIILTLPAIEQYVIAYNSHMPLVNENISSYLGIGAILGFLLSIIIMLCPVQKESAPTQKLLHLFSRLNIFAILFATVGGFCSLFSLAIHFLRCFNRISIYIMFISICILCISLETGCDYFFKKNHAPKRAFMKIIIACFLAICLIDQLPTYGANDAALSRNKENYISDRAFVEEIECLLQPGDMVFQLPYHQYPEAGAVNNMSDYHLFTGYLHSSKLKWSYGGMKGRDPDKWHEIVSSLPIEELIQIIIEAGFRGIYIDARAYTADELTQLTAPIEETLQLEPIYSGNNNLLFFNLYPYCIHRTSSSICTEF